MAGRICTIASLDHLVLTVKSIPRTVAFYSALGMKHEQFGPSGSGGSQRHALRFGPSKINLHELGNEIEPKAAHVQAGSGDLCFLVAESVHDVLHKIKGQGIEVLEGGEVVERTGARGRIRSVYIRDPDGNLVELSNYIDDPANNTA